MAGSLGSAMGDLESKRSFFAVIVSLATVVVCLTDPGDVEILQEFRKGLDNPELLQWPENGGDPCGPPLWKHVYCDENHRVSQIQVRGLGLSGSLPKDFNKLSKLTNLGLQQNNFSGMIPSFSGLSELRYAYLDFNQFDSIPPDFFDGLENLEVLALDYNNLNASNGWSIPDELRNSLQLRNLSLMNCNLVGPLPEFLGSLASLSALKLSMNRISGEIPASLGGLVLQILWLNDQSGGDMLGSIDVIASMVSLTSLWLHGNSFTGMIPENIGALTSLKDLNLNGNNLVGLVPVTLANMNLDRLDLNNNHLMGPVPKFRAANASYESNSFCESTPGVPCAPQVMALLEFLHDLNYPSRLVSSWSGNDPCQGPWLGLSCTGQEVSIINLPKFGLSGTLSPAIANLDSLVQVRLGDNNITGPIPANLTRLKSLSLLDLRKNNVSPPLPDFGLSVKVIIDGNPLLNRNSSKTTLSAPPPMNSRSSGSRRNTSSRSQQSPLHHLAPPAAGSRSNSSSLANEQIKQSSSKSHLIVIVAPLASFVVFMFLAVPLSIYCCKKKKKDAYLTPSALVIHPRDPSDPENNVKFAVASNPDGSVSSLMEKSSASATSGGMSETHIIESGNLVISVQVLRNVTKKFSPENELGRGGFGVVYKGELHDGTKIAVKRMESDVISRKALDEFHAEIAVLSKVRHRHLVSLLGYSVEGNEKILVYEYMPKGALSMHLFHWKTLKLDPLSWKRRLNIALDVARGMEYLHSLAHQSFIHRDLKPSNILLGDDYNAKVSDFGLVKLAPDGAKSVATRLAGTFGYLAPEYAVMGKITTKSDVFSFGVVLMELLTGLAALDEDRPEESQYLAAWFWHIKSDEEKLTAAIDPALDVKEDTFESITVIAELAGHCTAREPSQRPDMGHVVNVLSPLVEKWKPLKDDAEEYSGIDYSLPLNQMVKGWQDAESKDLSYSDLENSRGSIPARPTGFAESFTSADGR